MARDASRMESVRRSWRVRLTSGGAFIVTTAWAAITTVISVANLPGDASDAWKAIVSAPEFIPYGLAILCVGALIWSFLPPKQPSPADPSPLPAPPPADEHFGARVMRAIADGVNARPSTDIWDRIDDKEQEARVYQAELARKRAAITAKAQLMTDRLASRNHSMMEPGRSPTHDSYLAAMWDAEERGEILDETHRSTFPPPPPNRWELMARAAKLMGVFEVPLRDVVRRVAFDSKWAIRYDRTDALALTGTPSAPKWQVDLKAEILRQLCTIRSRGIYQEAGEKPNNGESAIPLAFWQRADFDVVDMLVSDIAGLVFIPGEVAYHDVKLDEDDIERIWPKRGKRSLKERPSPFHEWAVPWRENADYRAAFNEKAWDIDGPKKKEAVPDDAERRRALIAKGRDVVHRWRTSDRSLEFEIFASQDRDYLDIQPYLGDEYQAERSRRRRTVYFVNDVEDFFAGQLARELHRLAKEWGLE